MEFDLFRRLIICHDGNDEEKQKRKKARSTIVIAENSDQNHEIHQFKTGHSFCKIKKKNRMILLFCFCKPK